MTTDVLYIPGGIGLFLLGMLVLTDGLRALAGDALRHVLARFTASPLSGAVTGAATTAVIQSSSATTVTAVGFVGAGLLTFPQALGVIFGANVGTTATGWLVALLGFKLQIGAIALPLVLVGVALRLFAPGRWRDAGWALAGFSLVFIGIDALQQGMAVFEGRVTPDDFPADTLLGRLQLVGVGILVTMVTQSSSAGVAMAMVALGAGSISLPQAAALVIGMDVGTTATAALATLGGSTAMRQTGLSHVVYNLLTGAMAFALLTPWAWLVQRGLASGDVAGDAQVALVGFHTVFNLLGVLLVLPFARPFARFVQWLIPEAQDPAQRFLDRRLLSDPAAAVDASVAGMAAVLETLRQGLTTRMATDTAMPGGEAEHLQQTLAASRRYVFGISAVAHDERVQHQVFHLTHAIDHGIRLLQRCAQPAQVDLCYSRLRRLETVVAAAAGRSGQPGSGPWLARACALLERQHERYRDWLVQQLVARAVPEDQALGRLDHVRWLHRSTVHLWRMRHHLDSVRPPQT